MAVKIRELTRDELLERVAAWQCQGENCLCGAREYAVESPVFRMEVCARCWTAYHEWVRDYIAQHRNTILREVLQLEVDLVSEAPPPPAT